MGILALTADERVTGVRFSRDSLSIALKDGRTISVPLAWYPRLFNASAAERKNWQIAGGGYGIHWPDIDEDLSTEGLLRGAYPPEGGKGPWQRRPPNKTVNPSGGSGGVLKSMVLGSLLRLHFVPDAIQSATNSSSALFTQTTV